MTVSGTGSQTWYYVTYPLLDVVFQPGGPWTLTIAADNKFASLSIGSMLVVLVTQDGTDGSNLITWPANFLFSGSDAVPSPGLGARTKYTGIFAPDGDVWMTKTVYP
jgi:hypothetical protein